MNAVATSRAHNVVVRRAVLAKRFPIPFACGSLRAQPTHTPASTNTLHGRPWVVLFLEQKPVGVDPFEQPVNSDKISLLHDDRVNFTFPRWHCLGKCRREHGSEVL